MIEIGKTQVLTVREKIGAGALLGQGRDMVLLPNKLGGSDVQVEDDVRVFVYTDSEDRPVATTQTPKAQVGDFCFLKVVDESRHGSFLDWGLDKDLFVPHSEQHEPMVVGRQYVVAVFLDNATGRVAAASRLAQFLDYDVSGVKIGSKVPLLVYSCTARGMLVIVDDRYSGLVYSSETFTDLSVGQRLDGYVDKVRSDNKLDLRLQRTGSEGQKDAASVVLEALSRASGVLSLGDQSPAERIYEELGLSKKAFKAAVGSLYKAGKVVPGPHETRFKK